MLALANSVAWLKRRAEHAMAAHLTARQKKKKILLHFIKKISPELQFCSGMCIILY
jgi:hypothetical protein